jgi:low temperature requirement protein LtrA
VSSEVSAARDENAERRTSPVELFWDLVFVFAVTSVTTSLIHDLSWAGLARSLLLLALIWWAWSAYVWVANAHDTESPAGRATLLAALVLIFVAGVALPHAYRSDGEVFAATYAGVRLLHLALYADASRRGGAKWSSILSFTPTTLVAVALLLAGAGLGMTARTVLWAAAALVDYGGPVWLSRGRLHGLQRVAVAHFAERYGLFVLICLGESIAAIGVSATRQRLDGAVVAAVLPALAVTIGMWWSYFDRVAAQAERRLRSSSDAVLAGADAYSHLHLPLVAGIVVFAVGARASVTAPGVALPHGARLCLVCGVAAYLAAHAAFQRRLLGRWAPWELATAAALVAFGVAANGAHAWLAGSVTAVLLAVMCVVQHSAGDDTAAVASSERPLEAHVAGSGPVDP